MAIVDVVVVSYNSRGRLRGAVESLCALEDINVIVVDNASADDSLADVAELPVTTVPLPQNFGFAYGCNRGIEQGRAPFVLLLNPDARLEPEAVLGLARTVEEDDRIGAAGPRIVDDAGRLDFSQRRFPRLYSTFARAFFVHRLIPGASWVDEMIRDEAAYVDARDAEWISGACMLLRRDALEVLGGLDESFFMYCEDTDLCRRLWDRGWRVRFEPAIVARHEGGASAPRSSLLPVLAASRRLYAEKHRRRLGARLERLGIALEAAIRVLLARGGRAARLGHARALSAALRAS